MYNLSEINGEDEDGLMKVINKMYIDKFFINR